MIRHLVPLLLLGLLPSLCLANQAPELSLEAQQIIDRFNMQPIPHEGAFFVQTAKSKEVLNGTISTQYEGTRFAYSAIYSLLSRHDFSAIHKLKTDEIWHFYGGAPAEILLLYPNGKHETKYFGGKFNEGQHPQIVVPKGVWMGARVLPSAEKDFTFFGTTMAPAFEFQDYIAGDRDTLIKNYPDQTEMILALTRGAQPSASEGEQTPPLNIPALQIEELVGRNVEKNNREISVAKVKMRANTSLPKSFNRKSTEVVIVVSGEGTLEIKGVEHEMIPNEVLLLPPGETYQFTAHSDLVFYAIVTPAFTPEDHIEID